jgi:hypothetical protein
MAGNHAFHFTADAGTGFGAKNPATPISFNVPIEAMPGSIFDYTFGTVDETQFQFKLDLTTQSNPMVTLIPQVDYGPYGPLYLKGGTKIMGCLSPWADHPERLFKYDRGTKKLSLSYTITSACVGTSQNIEDWLFKLADSNWSVQLTGQSNDWTAKYNNGKYINEVVFGSPYTLGLKQDALLIDSSVNAIPGTYLFEVDTTNVGAPILTLTKH